MSDKPVAFTREAARKIAAVVREQMRQPVSLRGRRRRHHAPAQSAPVLVTVTGSASGGGKYTGKTLAAPAAMAAATGNLAETDLGVVADANDALVLNVREVGKSTHDLASTGFLPLVFIGKKIGVNADGKQVIVIDGLQQEDCA